MKPSIGFLLAAVLGIIGICLWGVGLFSFISSFQQTGRPLQAPGTTLVTIAQPGKYTIWCQTSGIVDGQFKSFPDQPPSGLTVKVTKKPEGTVVPMQSSTGATISTSGTRRVSFAELNFDSPGQYQVDITGLEEKHVMHLDRAKLMKTVMTFLLSGLAGFGFVIASIVLGIYALIRLADKKNKSNPIPNQPTNV